MPTFAELTHTNAPNQIDGISAVDALLGKEQKARPHFFIGIMVIAANVMIKLLG